MTREEFARALSSAPPPPRPDPLIKFLVDVLKAYAPDHPEFDDLGAIKLWRCPHLRTGGHRIRPRRTLKAFSDINFMACDDCHDRLRQEHDAEMIRKAVSGT